MDIEKKMAKKTFHFLAIAIIAYEVIFQFVVFGIDFVEMTLLLFLFENIQWEQAAEYVYNSGIALSLASIIGVMIVGLILMQTPDFQKKHKITLKTMITFYILMQGLQLLGNYILIPMNIVAELMGYSFDEAISLASDSSILLSAFIYSVIVAPIAEEILCRGIIMTYLEKYGKTFAVLITAMLFGLLHQNIVQFPITMMIGVLFGYLAQRYSLTSAIMLHVLNNLSVEITGMLGERYDIVWQLDALFLYFCVLASIVILWKHRNTISDFLKYKTEDISAIHYFFTTPLMLIVIAYFLFFTIKSVTPF
ncbi:type II CAAX endopeptidase family protein [Lachnospiraceae bacterium 46-61]